MAPLRFVPTSMSLGQEVRGVDLRHEQSAALWDRLRHQIHTHWLLVFRGQELTDDQHVEVARRFGRVAAEGIGHKREVMFVSNHGAEGLLGEAAASFHIDFGFFAEPYEYLSLYGQDIPATGTQTFFVNGARAAATLPDDLRRRISGREARHVLDLETAGGQQAVRVNLGRCDNAAASMIRPVLWPHRRVGTETLGVWQQQTDSIVGLPEPQSTALVQDLFDHLYQPAHAYVHEWRAGDLVVWDNQAVQHARPEAPGRYPRTLRRVAIGQDQDTSVFAGAPNPVLAVEA